MGLLRGDEALRRNRVSIPFTTYFVTLCTRDRRLGLSTPVPARAIQAELASVEADGHGHILGAVIMPDHVHVVFRLKETLTLGRWVARFKTRTRSALSLCELSWQSNFYEHRLRPDEPLEPVLRYVFLNPYRGGLVRMDERWPWFWLGNEEKAWFVPTTDDGKPFPEWLR